MTEIHQRQRRGKAALFASVLLCVCLLFSGCGNTSSDNVKNAKTLAEVPAYDGSPYVEINDNEPEFKESELTEKEFETYGQLDRKGRCTTAYVNVSPETLPTEKRGSIGMVKPTAWHSVRYSSVDGGSLYNRCHLVAHELAGEDANEKNLITGTRYMNTQGMLPFENEVADYVKDTGNHVLYEVTPVFDGNNLLASGVHMQAESVEDDGAGIKFNIYCYNVQPGIELDYATGDSYATDGSTKEDASGTYKDETGKNDGKPGARKTFILNRNTKKFHRPSCPGAKQIKSKNRSSVKTTADKLIKDGYEPCRQCNPD